MLLLLLLLAPPLLLLLLQWIKAPTPPPPEDRRQLPPSPPTLPIIGNLHQIMSPLPHRPLTELAKLHGPLMLLRLGGVQAIVVSSAAMAREILRTHDAVFASRPSLKTTRALLDGSFNISFSPYGEPWKQRRRLCVTHLLSSMRVQSIKSVREEEASFLIQKISSGGGGGGAALDMSKLFYHFANDLVCRVVVGKLAGEGKKETFRRLLAESQSLVVGFHLEDYFPSLDRIIGLLRLDGRVWRNATEWDRFLDHMLDEHREDEEEEDFVDVLLSLQNDPSLGFDLTKKDIKKIVLDILAGGTDTTYAFMEWALSELVRRPEAMEKLQEEVRGFAAASSPAPEMVMIREEELKEAVYLKAVTKEVLRLHPPPLLVPRESMEDCEIAGFHVPKGTRVLVNAWAISRDPASWGESPEEFRPERFMGSEVDFKGRDFEFVPFGAGRRSCPGTQFAVSAVELALANVVCWFDWEVPGGGGAAGELDMAEAPGLTVRRKEPLVLVPRPWRRL